MMLQKPIALQDMESVVSITGIAEVLQLKTLKIRF